MRKINMEKFLEGELIDLYIPNLDFIKKTKHMNGGTIKKLQNT